MGKMKKYFIISDVHSYYDELMTALNSAGFEMNNQNHILISLGDFFDRGPKSAECLKFISSLPDERKILIKGNHELLFEEIIKCNYFNNIDYQNGTLSTFEQLADTIFTDSNHEEIIEKVKNREDIKEYFAKLQNYAEIGDNIFVHGWIPCDYKEEDLKYRYTYKPNWRNASITEWEDASWLNPFECWSQGVLEQGKTIFCGHWHTSWGHHYLHNKGEQDPRSRNACLELFIDKGIIALDACTAISGKVNIYVLETDHETIINKETL